MMTMVNKSFIELPTPSNISFFWNFGSLLGLCLFIQMMSGMFLAMHYSADMNMAFSSIIHITSDVNYGSLLSYIHANGASLFFFCVYLHIGRGLFYSSYLQTKVWYTGMIIFFFMMLMAFMGYVLPWGQMSFWGATVMTNLLSAIPYIGGDIVFWVWGGFSVSNATLNSFYSLHYLLPFLLFGLVLMHLAFLHTSGSNNPLGVKSEVDKVPFHTYFVFKDLLGYFFVLTIFVSLVFLSPNLLNDPENFMQANPLVTPTHMQPEWYFLFAYAILSSVPNKLGGVMLMCLSMIMLFFLPLFHASSLKGLTFSPFAQFFFWVWIINFLFLTWMGSRPVEYPFMQLGQICTCFYFLYFMLLTPVMSWLENSEDNYSQLSRMNIMPLLMIIISFSVTMYVSYNTFFHPLYVHAMPVLKIVVVVTNSLVTDLFNTINLYTDFDIYDTNDVSSVVSSIKANSSYSSGLDLVNEFTLPETVDTELGETAMAAGVQEWANNNNITLTDLEDFSDHYGM